MPYQETEIRLLVEIVTLLMGRQSTTAGIRLSLVAIIVIEMDGGIEQADSLKSA
jgi:uncharacterized protein